MSTEGTQAQADVKQTLAYRGLKAAVIVLGVLIVVALAAVVAGVAMKLRSHGPAQPTAGSFTPPPGAKLVTVEASGDRVVLRLKTRSGEEVDIVDLQDGHLVARFRFAP